MNMIVMSLVGTKPQWSGEKKTHTFLGCLYYTFSDLLISSGTYDSPRSSVGSVKESTLVSEILDGVSDRNYKYRTFSQLNSHKRSIQALFMFRKQS